MKSWINTPMGTMVTIVTLVLVPEFIVEIYLEEFLELNFNFSDKGVEALGHTVEIITMSLLLYFLVFRRITDDTDKFSNLTDSAQDAIIMMDPDQRISFWNKSAERIFGFTTEEALGHELHSLIAPPAVRDSFAKGFKHFQKSGQGPVVDKVLEVTAVRKSGEEFPAELSISATQIAGQWHAIGIIRDISERKKTENAMMDHETALLELNKKLLAEKKTINEDMAKDDALLSSIGEGILATDDTGKIIAVNPAAEKILRVAKDDVLGKDVAEMIPTMDESGVMVPPEKHAVTIVLAKRVSVTSNATQYVHKKDKQRTPVAVTVAPVILRGKLIGTISVFRDITIEKEIEKTRGDLLALASHQLRTPLSGTKWLIETLQSGLKGPLNEDQKEYLGEIYNVNQRMTSLVNDMLGVLRMEGGAEVLVKRKVSTKEIFDTILEIFTPVAKGKQLTLVLDRDGEHTVETDPVLLRNILESLISNAMNYSNSGSEILVSLRNEPHELVFTVKDSGIGIPLDEQARLFERFYRASNAKIFNTRGTGLRLYIAATLAEKIGATLSFESEEGKGSTFFVHLPYSEPRVLPENTTNV